MPVYILDLFGDLLVFFFIRSPVAVFDPRKLFGTFEGSSLDLNKIHGSS